LSFCNLGNTIRLWWEGETGNKNFQIPLFRLQQCPSTISSSRRKSHGGAQD
jgi:hypothetical protein